VLTADNLNAFVFGLSRNSESLNILKPQQIYLVGYQNKPVCQKVLQVSVDCILEAKSSSRLATRNVILHPSMSGCTGVCFKSHLTC
jgi:hypothetical protein